MKSKLLAFLLCGIWVNLSETLRWELLIKAYWEDYYEAKGLIFPGEPANGFVWLTWGFIIAFVVFVLSRKFSLLQTTLLSWLALFVTLWIVLWNIDILPIKILPFVVPLSFIEVLIGTWIIRRISPN